LKKVAITIGWGWDWERIKPLIVGLEETGEFRFQVYVSGSALCARAGAPVRLISGHFHKPDATVAMFSELAGENRPGEAVIRASRGLLRVIRRKKPHILLTFGTDITQLAAAFAATALKIPHIHIIRGEEKVHPDERYTKAILSLSNRTTETRFLHTTGEANPTRGKAICVVEPYSERHPADIIRVFSEVLLGCGKEVLFVCAFADKSALRRIRKSEEATVLRHLEYEEFLNELPDAEFLLTNTETALIEARLSGTPAVYIRSGGGLSRESVETELSSALEGRKEKTSRLRILWDVPAVAAQLRKLTSGYESRGL